MIEAYGKTADLLLSAASPAIRNTRTGPVFAPPDSYRDGFRDEGLVQGKSFCLPCLEIIRLNKFFPPAPKVNCQN
jgi:hypothetical protein